MNAFEEFAFIFIDLSLISMVISLHNSLGY